MKRLFRRVGMDMRENADDYAKRVIETLDVIEHESVAITKCLLSAIIRDSYLQGFVAATKKETPEEVVN